jgi:hypothetical protein
MLAHALLCDAAVNTAVCLDRELDCDQVGSFVGQAEGFVGLADVVVGREAEDEL